MSALKNYCDKIHEYIRLYGEDYIWHIGWQIELYPQNRIIDAITNRKRKNTKSLKGILSDLNRSARNVLTHVKNVSMK